MFLYSTVAAVVAAHAPAFLRVPAGWPRGFRAGYIAGGACVEHRRSTRWSGYTMSDVA